MIPVSSPHLSRAPAAHPAIAAAFKDCRRAFWGVALPWLLCVLFSAWFCFGFMADDDLGRDADPGDGHA